MTKNLIDWNIQLVTQFNEGQIGLQSISDAIDTTTPQGRLFFNISACFAEFERDLMVFKTKAGQIGITNL